MNKQPEHPDKICQNSEKIILVPVEKLLECQQGNSEKKCDKTLGFCVFYSQLAIRTVMFAYDYGEKNMTKTCEHEIQSGNAANIHSTCHVDLGHIGQTSFEHRKKRNILSYLSLF